MRLIVDNGNAVFDLPYEDTVMELRECNDGSAALWTWCSHATQYSIRRFKDMEAGRSVLRAIKLAYLRGRKAFTLKGEADHGEI